ncbi:exopolysaccharide biosynthesis polyprenyl glycosylphosphotransferase [Oribacterium sp. Sow4_G1_1]|uniref:exopolysaccharide biosynthesis polyprenyl glycosylphosphotransferase n=1 Tax=Oribacterium sp. Sow4_G1_1 TaxID=3438794 RepID=UPI003F9DF800
MMTRKEKIKKILKLSYTALSLVIAFCTADAIWYWNVAPGWSQGFFGTETLLMVGILFCIVYFFFAKMYDAHKIGLYRLQELAFSQMLAYGISDGVLFIAAFFWFHNFQRIRIRLFLLAFALQLLLILINTFLFNRLYAHFDEPRKIMILYGSEDYKRLLVKIQEKKQRYQVLACMNESEDTSAIFETLAKCKDIYLCDVRDEVKDRVILFCNAHQKDIHISMDIGDLLILGDEVSHSFDTPFLRNKKTPVAWYYPFLKRFSDIVISMTAILLLSPIMIITALSIKLYDRGPVFYKQTRLTKDGRRFEIIKFRSMKMDAEKNGAQLSTVHDDRITPVGKIIRKLRIDELPQLFNILKNDMAVVGPRPERPEIAAQYEQDIPEFPLRLQVKAGLTGYAQVYGKYNTTPLDKLKLDLIYIAQRSVLFDLRILFYTIKIIFIPESTEGIPDGQSTAAIETK